ncbi:hypothetical protein [Nocardiopsis metallicus]|uniref:Uncharacterized protein n=1 Tax=Nocardiopsis metallicus TaxID=179819 RepID=A0A840WID4_9ACTN|nr:hypothetical protein [Nocardiopsis metallicus]MBB5495794.1 hypothetical protein [Nocardiopsis metallicus]
MTKTSTATRRPALPQIIATSMIHAQGYTLTAEERAAVVAKADFFESLGLSRTVTLKVIDPWGARIGSIEFNL